MSGNIYEFFGYAPNDNSSTAIQARKSLTCPFLNDKCNKRLARTMPSGACTIKPTTSSPVICCPNRLYSEDYKILKNVAQSAFSQNLKLVSGNSVISTKNHEPAIAVFGKRWGHELRLPKKGGKGNYFVDWVLALINGKNELQEFVAVEVQSIDTTGNYLKERLALLKGKEIKEGSTVGLNWENVNKRILPQLIYKGNVLRRENLCRKGLFFVCPTPVYDRIYSRLGSHLEEYPPDRGTITFHKYSLEDTVPKGKIRPLKFDGPFTTTVDQLTLAFDRAQSLPDAGVYEKAIRSVLEGN